VPEDDLRELEAGVARDSCDSDTDLHVRYSRILFHDSPPHTLAPQQQKDGIVSSHASEHFGPLGRIEDDAE